MLNAADARKAAKEEAERQAADERKSKAEEARKRAEAVRKRAEEARKGALDVVTAMEFVRVPAGSFRMGSTARRSFSDERPVTRVRISEGFYRGEYD